MTGEPVVSVPAELELEERLVGPVTFRMASWLAASAAGAALLGVGGLTAGRLALGTALLLAGLAGALWRPGGRSAPSWLRPMTGYLRRHARRPADHPGGHPVSHRARSQRDERVPLPTPRGTRRPVATAVALLLIVVAFGAGRLVRASQAVPSPARPLAPAVVPVPPVPVPEPVPLPADPWSGCGC